MKHRISSTNSLVHKYELNMRNYCQMTSFPVYSMARAHQIGIITPRLRRGRVIGPVCVCVCVSVCLCQKILKTLAKEPFRQKDGLKADIYATCTITFMFMYVVVLETAVSAIYSATSYYSLLV